VSCVLVLFVAIDVVVVFVFVFGGCPYPPFISKGVGVTRKVSKSVMIVVLVGLYL
jgi:hypothetical protein